MSKISKEEIELRNNPINIFRCNHPDCTNIGEMTHKDFKKHLKESHHLTNDQWKGRKEMVMHMDGDYWFSSTYKWTFDSGLVFHQFVKMARRQDDPMRYG